MFIDVISRRPSTPPSAVQWKPNNVGDAQSSCPRAAFWALSTLDLDLDLEMRGWVLFVGGSETPPSSNGRLAPPDAP